MHGGALAQKASKQKELSDHKLVKASNKRHGGGYSACALDTVHESNSTCGGHTSMSMSDR